MLQQNLRKTAGWGGLRKGAGRPRNGRKQTHCVRLLHKERFPLHVTLKARRSGLRTDCVRGEFEALLRRLRRRRQDFRVLQYSLQDNHLHLIVESSDRETLSSGMQGLGSGLARVINRVLGSGGTLWADRYHARELRTPREVRHALVYVLRNSAKHLGRAQTRDRFSSAPWFDGFAEEPVAAAPSSSHGPVSTGRTWLSKVGWRVRGGPLTSNERPKTPPAADVFLDYSEIPDALRR